MLLSKKGFEVINPFSIYHGERKGKPTTGQYMGADITALIDHADIIFMCSGWQHSKGCRVERFVAETYGKVIKFETVEEPERYYT